MGFNRYMVECKYDAADGADRKGNEVLIDTWWNVNLNFNHLSKNDVGVLIDTWWNVNKDFRTSFMRSFMF